MPASNSYCIWIVTPPGYGHAHAFDEIALSLNQGLKNLGKTSFITRRPEERKGRTIILGPHLLQAIPDTFILTNSILYNLEQIYDGNYMFTHDYFDLLRRFEVWDYSDRNIEALAKLGVHVGKKCAIGYVEALTKLPSVEEDIDVLIYGSMSERRTSIIKKLNEMGHNCRALFNVYGSERDAMIARAKIVLNVHHYPTKIFEMVRVSYLLANKKFVLSETSQEDEALTAIKDGIAQCNYEDLTSQCVSFLKAPDERKRIAERGFSIFRQLRQEEILREIL